MAVLVDDIGSFPLPGNVSRKEFSDAYPEAQRALAEGRNILDEPFLKEKFYDIVAASLWMKVDSGIDVVTYPQHYNMYQQFLDPIQEHQIEPFMIDKKYAVIPEVFVAEEEAKKNFDKKGKLNLKLCVTGPIELYIRTSFGYNIYEDILQNIAESVNRFLKNSIVKSKYIATPVVSLDEPSLGHVDLLNIEEDALISILQRAAGGISPRVQIHLHTLKAAHIPLQADGIDVITAEFAASPGNIDLISRHTLDEHDKFIRAGITRTDIDTIIGEFVEKGTSPKPEELVDSREKIRARYEKVKKIFSEKLAFVGPDCGLGSWPSQDVARLLLRRTVEAVK